MARGNNDQRLWIARPHERHFNEWLGRRRPLHWPIMAVGGSGKSSLLRHFLEACRDRKVPAVWTEPDSDIRLAVGDGLQYLLRLQTCHTPRFDKVKAKLLGYPEAITPLEVLGNRDVQDVASSLAGPDEKGLIVAALKVLSAVLPFVKRWNDNRIAKITRSPEGQLLAALRKDMRNGGVWLVDTWEKVGAATTLKTRLDFRRDDAGSNCPELPVCTLPMEEWLEGTARWFGATPALWVVGGRRTDERLDGLPIIDFGEETTGLTPFAPDQVADYLCRDIPGLERPDETQLAELMTLTKGNPFRVDRLATFLRREKMRNHMWSWADWPAIRAALPSHDEFGLANLAVQTLMEHSGLGGAPLWRLTLPRILRRDMADILFPPGEGDPSGAAAFRACKAAGLLHGDGGVLHLHDLDREALLALRDAKAAQPEVFDLHRRLAEFWEARVAEAAKSKDWLAWVSGLTEAAYHTVMAWPDYEAKGPTGVGRIQFWSRIEQSAFLMPWVKLDFAQSLPRRGGSGIRELFSLIESTARASLTLDLDAMRLMVLAMTFNSVGTMDWRAITTRYPGNLALTLALATLKNLAPGDREQLFRDGVAANPSNASLLGEFANFMHAVRGDVAEAEQLFLMARDADSENANNNGNFARLLIDIGREKEAKKYIDSALTHAPTGHDPLRLECWFYCYAVFPDRREEALVEMKVMLEGGVSSPGWGLAGVVKRAKELGHPDPERLEALATAVSRPKGEALPEGLFQD